MDTLVHRDWHVKIVDFVAGCLDPDKFCVTRNFEDPKISARWKLGAMDIIEHSTVQIMFGPVC